MSNVQKANSWSRFFYSNFFLVVIFLGIIFVGFAFVRSYYQDYQVKQDIERLKLEADNLEAKKIETLEILQYVQSPDYAEGKARMDFNMVKPGEHVAIIKGAETSDKNVGQVDKKMIESSNISNIIKWWKFFTGA